MTMTGDDPDGSNPAGKFDEFDRALLTDDPEVLYERAPCGYLSTAPDGTILKVNRTFATLVGYEPSELVGCMAFVDLLSGGGRIYHETHYAPMLRMHGTAREIALDLVRKDGSRVSALVNSVMEVGPDGEPTTVRAAVFDATERRGYERELLHAKRLAEESEARATLLARTLQQTLIPPAPPDIPGLDLGTAFRPAGTGAEIGGDFFDVFEIADDDWVVAIGDVCGKGAEAAVVTALARHSIRAAAVRHPHPWQMLEVTNDVLLQDDSDRFTTIVIIRLRRTDGTWTATMSTGGHPLPLLRRADGELVEVGAFGSLVGALTDVTFSHTDVALQPGDLLVLYTDGVTEGRAHDGEFYGDARLTGLIAASTSPVQGLVDEIVQDSLDFQGGDPRDDVAVVAVSVPPPGRSMPESRPDDRLVRRHAGEPGSLSTGATTIGSPPS